MIINFPNNSHYFYQLGHRALEANDLQEAIVNFQKSLGSEFDPDVAIELLELYTMAGEFTDVKEAINEWFPNQDVLELDYEIVAYLLNAYIEIGQLDQAQQLVTRMKYQSTFTERSDFPIFLLLIMELGRLSFYEEGSSVIASPNDVVDKLLQKLDVKKLTNADQNELIKASNELSEDAFSKLLECVLPLTDYPLMNSNLIYEGYLKGLKGIYDFVYFDKHIQLDLSKVKKLEFVSENDETTAFWQEIADRFPEFVTLLTGTSNLYDQFLYPYNGEVIKDPLLWCRVLVSNVIPEISPEETAEVTEYRRIIQQIEEKIRLVAST